MGLVAGLAGHQHTQSCTHCWPDSAHTDTCSPPQPHPATLMSDISALPPSCLQRFLVAMEPYQSACINSAAASNWLGARLQLLAALLLSAVACMAAVVAATLAGSAGSGSSSWVGDRFRVDLLGLALAYCLPIVNLLNGLLTSSAETEQDMVAVERVAALLDDMRALQQQDAATGSSSHGNNRPQQQPALTPAQMWQNRRLHSRRWQIAASSAAAAAQQPQDRQLTEPLLRQRHEAGGRAGVPPPAQQQAGAWDPTAPAIELRNVVMRYRPHLPPALLNVSLSVPAGLKLGVCGRTGEGHSRGTHARPPALLLLAALAVRRWSRCTLLHLCPSPCTDHHQHVSIVRCCRCVALRFCAAHQGAGKSSLMHVLLRLRPIESGVLLVHGQDAAALSLRELRGRFGVVPQQPLLFAGSVRDNLDPWGHASDEQLASTLQVLQWGGMVGGA